MVLLGLALNQAAPSLRKRTIELSNGLTLRCPDCILNTAETTLRSRLDRELSPLLQVEVGVEVAHKASKPVIRKQDRGRSERVNLFKEKSHTLVEVTVAVTCRLNLRAVVARIAAALFNVSPELVLNPIGLLKVDHEDVPCLLL